MSSLKSQALGLQANVVSSYDQTKTTTFGRMLQRTFQSTSVLAPTQNKWIDVFSDSAETPIAFDKTVNGRIFIVSSISAGLARVMCYTFNDNTGASVYVGKIQVTLPNTAATTHTIRGFKVDDINPSAIKIFISTTGSVLINGGLFFCNNVNITDFTNILSVTLPFGQGSNQKAVYLLQDPAGVGAGQANTVSTGISLDRTGQIAYVHNGTAAASQFFLYDYSLTPNNPGQVATLTIASPGVVNITAHGFNAGDQVTFTTTGSLPTGLVVGTTYFVIASGLTANAFEVSATTGGAAINFTGAQSGTQTVFRGFGETTSLFKWKTGNLPVLTGTLLNDNSENYCTPGVTNPSPNAGSACIFFATTTNIYLGKVSELTSGVTVWPSLATANLLGVGNQVTAPTAVNATYDSFFDVIIISTSSAILISKYLVNNSILGISGALNNLYLEGVSQTDLITTMGAVSGIDLKAANGWTMILGSTTGQRGIIAQNTGADIVGFTFGLSTATYFISPVISFGSLSTLVDCTVSQIDKAVSAKATKYYRTSGFGSATGGWTLLPDTDVFPALSTSTQIQFLIGTAIPTDITTNPAMVIEGYISYVPLNALSDNWEGSVDNTTQNGASPARTAFRLTNSYATVVPTMYFRAYDDSGNLVASANTSANASSFEYSTNNGTSWNALGTITNTALTTELRYNWTSPPGVRVTCSINES